MTTILILCLALVTPALGVVHWISEGQSIQEAVIGAAVYDTVVIQDGTYIESVVLYGKPLTVGSEYLIDADTTHIAQTVILGDPSRPDTNSCFVYAYNEPIGGRLVGLTLLAGQGTLWPVFNFPTGGNVFIRYASVAIERCAFREGTAGRGGGLFFEDEPWIRTAFCLIDRCTFTDCFAEESGGAVEAEHCSLRVALSRFESDTAANVGGALFVTDSYVMVDSCEFRSCYSDACGGVRVIGCQGYLFNSIFEHNGAGADPGGTHLQLGMGYYPFTVARCIFRENDGLQVPVWISGNGGYAPAYFVGNVIENNIAMLRTGILLIGSHAIGEVAYNVIRNNTSIHGGAINAFQEAHPRIHHNVFDGNVAAEQEWGAVFETVSNANPVLDSNIIINHAPPLFSHHFTSHVIIDARYNWWSHETGPYHPTLNPNGQGDSLLNDSVLFIPWLTEPPDTTMPSGVDDDERPYLPRTWELAALYPNPFNSSFTIVLAGFTESDFELSLHNLLGQVVDMIHTGPLTGGTLHYRAPDWLASGVYFVKASDHKGLQTRKVVLLK